tara:strand:+ start:242 stop:541 length:300 start_codon:yes stop_codon:yes gene_type:complete
MRYRLPDVKIYLSQWANTVGIKYASLKKRRKMSINNNDRANKVKRLLGLSGNKESKDTDKSYVRVADVLCDLQHYCDKYEIDMSQEKYMADVFYNEEAA